MCKASCRSSPACSARWCRKPTKPIPPFASACDRYISEHADRLVGDLAAAKALYAPEATWKPESLALYAQAALQGAFVLAKAKHGPEIAVECLDHLRRYVEGLLQAPPVQTNRRERRAMMTQQRITPCLWFNFNAEEAVAHYCAIFEDARIEKIAHYGPHQPGPEGAVMTILFSIEGQRFLALNGGPQFPFTSAISLIVNCDNQAEVDDYWERLSEGGAKGPLRLADRQVRRIVADRAARTARIVDKRRRRTGEPRHEGCAGDG